MNVLELFAGIGGIGLGLERAGMVVVGQVEIDPYCQRVLARHWPEVPRHDDVRTCIDWWRSEPRPDVDLVAGGFPCQPVSHAGHRRGVDDERWLWPDMANVVRVLRPRFVVVENVPGLFVRGFDAVQSDLAALGYDTTWDCVSAAAVGAPHLRDRIFIVASVDQPSGAVPDTIRDTVRVERQRGREQHEQSRPALAGNDGTSTSVADPDSDGELQPQGRVGEIRGWTGNGSSPLADTDGEHRQTRQDREAEQRPREREPDRSGRITHDVADTDGSRWRGGPGLFRSSGWRQPTNSDWWAVEPDVGRVADGVPARVDRLRVLGNAVVPKVAQHVGELILAAAGEGAR